MSQPVGIGAICDLRARMGDERSQEFDVSEFIALADGRRVTLHADRGFAIGTGSGEPVRGLLTEEQLVNSTLNTVLPDADDQGPHPWEWLLELAHARGLTLTLAEIQALPYDVVLTPRVKAWLHGSAADEPTSAPATDAQRIVTGLRAPAPALTNNTVKRALGSCRTSR